MAKRKSQAAAARKQQLQRKRSLMGALSVALFALVLGAGGTLWYQYLSQPGKLPLRVVEIQGEFVHLQRSEIETRVAKAINGGFFTVDMAMLRQTVMDMPWVGEVSLRRVWPDTLRMRVKEQQALAYWGSDSLLNMQGDIFTPDKVPQFTQLPTLQGDVRFSPEMVTFFVRLYSRLVNTDLKLKTLNLNQRKEWRLLFNNNLELVLGRQNVDQRLDDFLRVYPQMKLQMPRQAKRIDMRYEHGFSVKWTEETKTQVGAVLHLPKGGIDG